MICMVTTDGSEHGMDHGDINAKADGDRVGTHEGFPASYCGKGIEIDIGRKKKKKLLKTGWKIIR